MVDCADQDRIEEAKTELHKIANDREMKDAVILIFANKQVKIYNCLLITHPYLLINRLEIIIIYLIITYSYLLINRFEIIIIY